VFLIHVMLWVLPSVAIAVVLGVAIGRATGLPCAKEIDNAALEKERQKMLHAMQALLTCTEQLASDVGSHNAVLHETERSIDDVQVEGVLGVVQSMLLTQVSSILAANQRLEDDLVCARYELEEQARELDRTRQEARTDDLAGIANRKALFERLDYLLSVNKRRGTSFAIVICDVDRFKWINDTHGHQAGDRVINQMGRTLDAQIRETDLAGRLGGDEFVLLLYVEELQQAIEIGNRIRRVVEQSNFNTGGDGEHVAVTLSMGLTVARSGDTAESIMARADESLYSAKRNGRNQLNVFQQESELVAVEV